MSQQTREALFISHAKPEDNAFARWLGAKLAAMGYEVWADVMRLHGGADWSRELEVALRLRAAKVLLVCTPSAMAKQGVWNEIEIAAQLSQQFRDPEFIIPLRLQHFEAHFQIAQLQYVDFTNGWGVGLMELVELLSTLKRDWPAWWKTNARLVIRANVGSHKPDPSQRMVDVKLAVC